MFKEMLRGFTSFFTSEKVLILVIFLVLVIGLSMYSGFKKNKYDSMTSGATSYSSHSATVTPSYAPTDSVPAQVDQSTTFTESVDVTPNYVAPTRVPETTGLLPDDQNSQWANLNPVNSGNIATPDLLQAGFNIGLDTIGQSLRNANYQLRSDPIIAKQNVGPWMQSTIEPDLGRVPLEIGSFN
jgi:hypothetical protein